MKPHMARLLSILFIGLFCVPLHAQQSNDLDVDVVILGGSPSGLAAAVQAARLGSTVIVVEPYEHIGGMMSAGLTRTDFGDRNTTGGIPVEVFKRIAVHYDPEKRPWAEQQMKVFFEPHVAKKVFQEMVAESGRIQLIMPGQLMKVEMDGDTLRAMTIRRHPSGERQRIQGKVFIDATYEGDLAAMAGAPYRTGREAKSEYKEPHGLAEADKLLQAYCFRLCVTDDPANRVAIRKPDGYDPLEFELLGEYVRKKNIKRFAPDCLYAREKVNHKADGNAQWHCWVSTDWASFHHDYPEGRHRKLSQRPFTLIETWNARQATRTQNRIARHIRLRQTKPVNRNPVNAPAVAAAMATLTVHMLT